VIDLTSFITRFDKYMGILDNLKKNKGKEAKEEKSEVSLPKEDFPIIDQDNSGINIKINSKILFKLIDKTKFAISNEEITHGLLLAAGFIFTTSMSPVICAGALASIKYVMDHNELREQHQERAKTLKEMLRNVDIEVLDCASTHIVPVMIRDAKLCKKMSDILLEDYNIYIQPINWPTVDVGTERLRIAPTPLHTDAMMHDLVEALRKVFKRVKEGCL